MNKYQEALDGLVTNIKIYTVLELSKQDKQNLATLQELVDKEISMKVIYENDLVDENVVVDTWAYCPTCKEEILYALWGNLNYCPNCGQHLDWSDDDED